MESRIAIAALLASICSGCIVLPKQATTTSVIEIHDGATISGPVGSLVLRTARDGRNLVLTASRPRSCTAEQVEVVEIDKHMTPRSTCRTGPTLVAVTIR
jgi:hypothetical protein